MDALTGGASRQVDFATIPGHSYAVVLDAPDGGLAAAALVLIDERHGRGHLALMAIADALLGSGLEHRVVAVAEALAAAFGCDTLDVSPRASRRAA